jgi:hypothetical protein
MSALREWLKGACLLEDNGFTADLKAVDYGYAWQSRTKPGTGSTRSFDERVPHAKQN